jgi:hypothetical protein
MAVCRCQAWRPTRAACNLAVAGVAFAAKVARPTRAGADENGKFGKYQWRAGQNKTANTYIIEISM